MHHVTIATGVILCAIGLFGTLDRLAKIPVQPR